MIEFNLGGSQAIPFFHFSSGLQNNSPHPFEEDFTHSKRRFNVSGGTIPAMKAYAINYGLDLTTQVDVQYGSQPTPESRYSTREQAARDCVRLNQTQVRIGSHCCAFAVDKLPDGGFGIICACHPQ